MMEAECGAPTDLSTSEPHYRNMEFDQFADFSGRVFDQDADFRGAVFRRGANFTDCVFTGKADFTGCQFFGRAYFWKVRFRGEAIFSRILVFERTETHAERRSDVFPGELNLSWAFFDRRADFARMRVAGPAYFYRTVFKDHADLSEAYFGGNALFEGGKPRVCISRSDGPEVYDQLVKIKLVIPAFEESADGRFANFFWVDAVEELQTRLESNGVTAAH
jgi:hypothetical protein